MFPFASHPSILYGGFMPQAPHPDGWKGGSEDFGFLRTFDGHKASIRDATSEDQLAENAELGRNVRWGTAAADIANYGDA
jgi:hypothetical protein